MICSFGDSNPLASQRRPLIRAFRRLFAQRLVSAIDPKRTLDKGRPRSRTLETGSLSEVGLRASGVA